MEGLVDRDDGRAVAGLALDAEVFVRVAVPEHPRAVFMVEAPLHARRVSSPLCTVGQREEREAGRENNGQRTCWLWPPCQSQPMRERLSDPERSSTLPAFAFTILYVLPCSNMIARCVVSCRVWGCWRCDRYTWGSSGEQLIKQVVVARLSVFGQASEP